MAYLPNAPCYCTYYYTITHCKILQAVNLALLVFAQKQVSNFVTVKPSKTLTRQLRGLSAADQHTLIMQEIKNQITNKSQLDRVSRP